MSMWTVSFVAKVHWNFLPTEWFPVAHDLNSFNGVQWGSISLGLM